MSKHKRIVFFGLVALLGTSCVEYDSELGEAAKYQASRERSNADAKPNPVPSGDSGNLGDGFGEAQEEDPRFSLFKDCASSDRKFVADLVRLSDDTKKLPRFEDLRTLGKVCIQQLNIAPRLFEEGFPGNPELLTYFGLNIKFKIVIKEGGEYIFDLSSDDGSKLFIGGVQVIDNDGKHTAASQQGKLLLAAGIHEVNLQYFQAENDIALELKWQKPEDAAPSPIPLEVVRRP